MSRQPGEQNAIFEQVVQPTGDINLKREYLCKLWNNKLISFYKKKNPIYLSKQLWQCVPKQSGTKQAAYGFSTTMTSPVEIFWSAITYLPIPGASFTVIFSVALGNSVCCLPLTLGISIEV